MDALDVGAVVRMALILIHLLAFAAAAIGIAFGDYAVFRGNRVDAGLLMRSSRIVGFALGVLWVSGLMVIWLDTHFDWQVLAVKPKLLAKLTVASLLTLNGIALEQFAFPRLQRSHRDPQHAALMPAILGAVSITTWLFAAFVGVGKPLASVLGYWGFLALYALGLVAGIVVALAVVRPRLASQLCLSAGGAQQPA